MIGVAESSKEPQKSFTSDIELYRALRDYIDKIISIRGQNMECTGFLKQVNFSRHYHQAYFQLDQGDPMQMDRHHHVEVLLDGNWKVLNPGSDSNAREL